VQEHHVYRNGHQVVGFGLGGMPMLAWHETRNKLVDMDRLIATGHGDSIIDGHTALATAALLREQMSAGLGDPAPQAEPAQPSPWKYALVTSLVGAATGWALDEIARRTFRKKRGRR
jgi:hypothetical protein